MKRPCAWIGALLLLLGCTRETSSDKVAGGGFETSDLNAVLVDSAGDPVVGARVWLLSRGADSLSPSIAIDSATSDSMGAVSFTVRRSGSTNLGLEAWLGDTLSGIRSRIDLSSTPTVPLRLKRTKVFSLPCRETDSSMFILRESHFRQRPPGDCQDSFRILVPPGDWSMLSVPTFGDRPPKVFHIHGDSLPPWQPPPGSDSLGWFGPRPPPPDSGSYHP